MSTPAQSDPAGRPTQPADAVIERKPSTKAIVVGVVAVLFVLFAVLNSQTVKIHLLVGTNRLPLIVVIVLCGLIGFAAGWFASRRRAGRSGG
jgi:uncharacterized integral membrane protein